jgi:ribosome-associated translation inhibitor RaiA
MRINVHSEGFRLTAQLQGAVVSRLLSALGPFGAHIELVGVRLRAGTGHGQPDTPLCEIAVSLHPAGEVRAQGEDAQIAVAIDRAANDIRGAVEHEVPRLQSIPSSPSPVGEDAGSSALEIVLDDNRITQDLREWLERPENYLRPVRVREYWRRPEIEHKEPPQEREAALATPPRQF